MPEGKNRFGVGELWDGIKSAVSEAFNTVSQKMQDILKQISGPIQKYLPMVNLILKVVTNLPGLIKSISAVVQALPKAFSNLLRTTEKVITSGFKALISPLPKTIQNNIKSFLNPILGALKSSLNQTTKAVGKAFTEIGKARDSVIKAVGKLPASITKEVGKLSTSVTKEIGKLPASIGKLFSEKIKDTNKLVNDAKKSLTKVEKDVASASKGIGDALKRFDKAAEQIAAKTLQPLKLVEKAVKDTAGAITKEVSKVPSAVVKGFDQKINAARNDFGAALKRFDKAAESITGAKLPDLAAIPRKAAEEGAKTIKPLLLELERPISAATKEVAKIGSQVSSVGLAVGDTAKSVGRMVPMLEGMFKIALNAAPIIDGFADYMQFEELNHKLDLLVSRQEPQTEALSNLAISLNTIQRKLEKIEVAVGSTSQGNSNSAVLNAIAAVRQDLGNLPGKLATSPAASAASIAQAIVGQLPNPDNAAIAQAVAAQLPKGASANEIAQAVAAKLPDGTKTFTASEIAIAVKAKLDPSFQAIDKKLPDNGIYRVDQAGIATAVKAKLDPSLQAIDKKLPDNGLFPVDKAGIASSVKATLEPNLTLIEGKVAQPVNLAPVLAAIALIPSKIPVSRPSDLTPVINAVNLIPSKIPQPQSTDLAPVLTAIAGLPGKIPTPNLTPIQSKLESISGVVQKIDRANEEQKPINVAVKTWDSARKTIGTKTLSVPKQQAEAIKLIADEAAEAQEDSSKDRAEKKSALQKVLNRLQIVRIINIMGTIATLHNAAMLSRNLADTLGDATSTVITAIGRATGTLTAEDSIDVNQIIGSTFNEFMKGALGEEVWNGTKASWLKANRVISSASNIITSIRSIADSQRAITEWTAENTGKIGNALKKWGVVGEKAYGWMPEKVTARTAFQKKIDDVRNGLDNLDDAASSLSSAASEVVNIQDETKQITDQWKEFDKNVKEATASVRPDNDPVKAAAAAAKAASGGKPIEATDSAATEV